MVRIRITPEKNERTQNNLYMNELIKNLQMIQDQIDPNLYVTLLAMLRSNDLDSVKNMIEACLDTEYSMSLDWFYSILPGQTVVKVLTF